MTPNFSNRRMLGMTFPNVVDSYWEERHVAHFCVLDPQRRHEFQVLAQCDRPAMRRVTGKQKSPDTVPPATVLSEAVEFVGDTAKKSDRPPHIIQFRSHSYQNGVALRSQHAFHFLYRRFNLLII